MTYRVLALDENSKYMSLPVLKKIRDLVMDGAIVTGPQPAQTPSLSDNQDEFIKIVHELWANEKGENTVGNGKVYAGYPLTDVLNSLKISPDFTYSQPQETIKLLYVHRKLGDVDFYWVNNRQNRVIDAEANFRVEGRVAEIWHPETGNTELASYSIKEGITRVPLHMEPNDAIFVVFRNKAVQTSHIINKPAQKQLTEIAGPWTVSFQPERGAPGQSVIETLIPWNENADLGIKYFSGTGTYSKTIQAPAEWLNQGSQLWLDLGDVKNLAEIIINGKSLGIVWKTPFRVNVTGAMKEGENKLEIKVTNLWVNRLIGDAQPGVEKKITYTTMPFYGAGSPLLPSGLLGPVTIQSIDF